MLGDISGLEKSTLSAVIRTCANRSMASVPLSKTSLRWIRHPVPSSCSVEEDGTGSKFCSMSRMALSWSINGCLSGVDINGPGSSRKSGIFPGGSLSGWCQELISTSQKLSKQSKKYLGFGKILHRKNGWFPYKFSVFQPLFSFRNGCVSGIIKVPNPRRGRWLPVQKTSSCESWRTP